MLQILQKSYEPDNVARTILTGPIASLVNARIPIAGKIVGFQFAMPNLTIALTVNVRINGVPVWAGGSRPTMDASSKDVVATPPSPIVCAVGDYARFDVEVASGSYSTPYTLTVIIEDGIFALDALMASPSNGDVPVYDSADDDFKPGAGGGGGGAITLDDLTDVDTTSVAPTDGQALAYDSGSSLWVPQTISGGGGMTQVFLAGVYVPPSTTMVPLTGFSFNMVASGAYLVNFDLFVYVDSGDGFRYSLNSLDYAFGVLHTDISGDHLATEALDEITPMVATGGPHAVSNTGFARARISFKGMILAPGTLAHSGLVEVAVGANSGGGNSAVYGGMFEYIRLF